MNPSRPKEYFAAHHRVVAYGGAIEWEELPSLAEHLVRPAAPAEAGAGRDPSQRGSAWDDTEPASLDAFVAAGAPQPLRETLEGLATREVTSPQVFQHFFGSAAPAR